MTAIIVILLASYGLLWVFVILLIKDHDDLYAEVDELKKRLK